MGGSLCLDSNDSGAASGFRSFLLDCMPVATAKRFWLQLRSAGGQAVQSGQGSCGMSGCGSRRPAVRQGLGHVEKEGGQKALHLPAVAGACGGRWQLEFHTLHVHLLAGARFACGA